MQCDHNDFHLFSGNIVFWIAHLPALTHSFGPPNRIEQDANVAKRAQLFRGNPQGLVDNHSIVVLLSKQI